MTELGSVEGLLHVGVDFAAGPGRQTRELGSHSGQRDVAGTLLQQWQRSESGRELMGRPAEMETSRTSRAVAGEAEEVKDQERPWWNREVMS